jgi:hypothetical protein
MMLGQKSLSDLLALPVAVIGLMLWAIAPASAAEKTGMPVAVYADPGDFVIELSVAGDCGSKFYHIQRNRTNFKEVVALLLTAYSSGKKVKAFVESCWGDRNIMSHAGSLN